MPEIVIGRDEEDSRKYGTEGTLSIGKHLVGTGEETHLTTPVLLDVLRPHVITLTGKRGEGKCLHEDSIVTLEDGSQIMIKDLEHTKGKILSLNDELKLQVSEREGFYKRNVDHLLHIKLRSGKEIKLTPEHPLLTIKGWKPATELKIGSRIATPRKMEAFGNQELPENKIKLLAYLIAEGHIVNPFVLFSNTDPAIVKDFEESVTNFDKNLKVTERSKGCYQVNQIKKMVKSFNIERNDKGKISKGSWIKHDKTSLVKWLEETGIYGKLSKQKFVPKIMLNAKKEHVSVFLNRLFSCDGSIYKREGIWEISYSSISDKLIKQVHHLLLRFGVLSKIRKKETRCNGKNFDSFELMIRGKDVDTFITEIGFFGKKEERQKTAIESSPKRNPNIDTVPKEIWELYKPINWAALGRAFNYKHPKAMRESMDYSPSRQKLSQIAEHENNSALRLLAESHIFWDEIIAMELIEGEFTVYDITVPEFHNFVANDIIVHNSYSMGVIAEEIFKLPEKIKKNLCCIIIDTQGIFWTMKSPDERELALLNSWGMKPRGFPVDVFVPEGQERLFSQAGVDFDGVFSVLPSQLTVEDWLSVFELKPNEPLGVLLLKAFSKLPEAYSIDDITSSIARQEFNQTEKLALQNFFEAAKSWGIFGESRMPKLLEPGKISVIDVSLTPQNVRALLLALMSKHIFSERVKARRLEELSEIEITTLKRTPMPWILIDEAHNFLPDDSATAATEILSTLIKEGRQPGITLVLATQRPEKLHPDALAQTDIIISHRLTSKADVDALRSIMQTYMLFDIGRYLNELPKVKGVAIILDDNSERIYKIRMRPRQSWHAGASPVAI